MSSHFIFFKKVVVVVLVLLTLTYLFLSSCYPRYGKIIAVEYDYDDIIVEDLAGLVWVWNGVEDWACGDDVAMIMWNRFTPNNIYDDVILKLR